jgi:hypothetical protein
VNNNDGKIIFETRGGETKVIEKRPVGRPRQPIEYASPNISVFPLGESPQAIKTELVIQNQVRADEKTLIWGIDDALPLHILNAIAESPTATNCVGKIETYTRGNGFSDPGLMEMVINEDGDTLWDLHCAICQYYSQLDGFTTNFKYNVKGRIAAVHNMATDSARLAAEPETNKICGVKYNPYFGTREYQARFTTSYNLFNLERVKAEYDTMGNDYLGQVYFHGTKRTLYKHYPVPKFWSGKKWIYSDAKFATYVEKLLDNGFFESVLMKVIGDPNKMSQHPDAMATVTENGVTTKKSVKTEGQMFNEMMGKNFSGVDKAGKVMALWSLNKDQSVTLEPFPTNVNPDLISGTLMEGIRMISISTDVPAILANLPNSLSSLASGGDAVSNAVDYMQSGTAWRRSTLENFYNNILLKNWAEKTSAKVKINQFSPVKTQVSVDDKYWEFMNEAEKIKFIQDNEPDITLIRTPIAEQNTIPATTDEKGNVIQAPTVPKVDEILKGLKVQEINRILSVVKKVGAGTLLPDQAKLLLSGYGLNEEQINAFLNPQPVEE